MRSKSIKCVESIFFGVGNPWESFFILMFFLFKVAILVLCLGNKNTWPKKYPPVSGRESLAEQQKSGALLELLKCAFFC